MKIKTPRVLTIADQASPSVRATFLRAARKMQTSANLSALRRALETGNLAGVDRALRTSTWSAALQPTVDELRRIVRRSGAYVADTLATKLHVEMSFDIKNPAAIRAAQLNGARMVTDVSASTRRGISNVIQRGLSEGLSPAETAKLIRPMIGLTRNQSAAVMNARQEWRAAGLTKELVDQRAERYTRKLLRQRALNIARTETISASAIGQQVAWDQAVERGLLDNLKTQREWIAALDERVCPICSALHGMKVGLKGTFSGGGVTVSHPPAHSQCRCTVGLVVN